MGKPLDPAFLDPALPRRAPRASAFYSQIARHPLVRDFILHVAKRPIPPEIIDDPLLDRIVEYIAAFGVEKGAQKFREELGSQKLAVIRAISMNVKKYGVQNG